MEESKLYAYCLQGDVTKAYEYLQSIPDKSKKVRELETKFYRRFFTEKPVYRYKTERLELTVIKDNDNAFNLYRKKGFVLEGEKVCLNHKW